MQQQSRGKLRKLSQGFPHVKPINSFISSSAQSYNIEGCTAYFPFFAPVSIQKNSHQKRQLLISLNSSYILKISLISSSDKLESIVSPG
ncbi:Uncharacterised protein [Bacillus freudenreichii]|nr:Uncharacterised protein [Bacillus freudenreichii]